MNIKDFPYDNESSYKIFVSQDCDRINPNDYFANTRQTMDYDLSILALQSIPEYSGLRNRSKLEMTFRFKTLAKQRWQEEYKAILATPVPAAVEQLLQERKKKQQQKLIKQLTFDTSLFVAIPIYAWHRFMMPYSKFITNHRPKELEGKVYPDMLHKTDEGKFNFVGATNLSNAEMQLALDKRNQVISEFVGDEDYWHCFFRTVASIRGNEVPHIGKPHIHYISSAWGISRQDVIKNLSSYRYNLRADTIPFKVSEWMDDSVSSPQR